MLPRGNQKFQKIVGGPHREEYQSTSNRTKKNSIADKILQMIQNSQGCEGRFLKKVSEKWVKVDDEEARRKIKRSLGAKDSSSSGKEPTK